VHRPELLPRAGVAVPEVGPDAVRGVCVSGGLQRSDPHSVLSRHFFRPPAWNSIA
jgi:hypothetical protein